MTNKRPIGDLIIVVTKKKNFKLLLFKNEIFLFEK